MFRLKTFIDGTGRVPDNRSGGKQWPTIVLVTHAFERQDVQEALGQFRSTADAVVDSFVQTLPKEPPPIIYHYTTDLGLRGILETGRIWLTDIFNLNDPSELHHGLDRAMEMLKRRVADGPAELRRFAEGLRAFFAQGWA